MPESNSETALEIVHAPAWRRHLREMRSAFVRRRDVLAAAVRHRFGDAAVPHRFGDAAVPLTPSGGMHLWMRLEDRVDDVALARAAAEAGVLVSAGRQWFPAEAPAPYLRLSYASAPTGHPGRAGRSPVACSTRVPPEPPRGALSGATSLASRSTR